MVIRRRRGRTSVSDLLAGFFVQNLFSYLLAGDAKKKEQKK